MADGLPPEGWTSPWFAVLTITKLPDHRDLVNCMYITKRVEVPPPARV